METRDHAIGVFHDGLAARDAIHALKDAGFRGEDISVLMPDADSTRELASATGASAVAGATSGAVAGGVLGGAAGWLVGVGALAIPGVGPFLAAGALGAALSGVAIGASVGAIAGALVGLGVPEDEARWYEREVRGGRALVSVNAHGQAAEARAILARLGGYEASAGRPDPGPGLNIQGTGVGTSDLVEGPAHERRTS